MSSSEHLSHATQTMSSREHLSHAYYEELHRANTWGTQHSPCHQANTWVMQDKPSHRANIWATQQYPCHRANTWARQHKPCHRANIWSTPIMKTYIRWTLDARNHFQCPFPITLFGRLKVTGAVCRAQPHFKTTTLQDTRRHWSEIHNIGSVLKTTNMPCGCMYTRHVQQRNNLLCAILFTFGRMLAIV